MPTRRAFLRYLAVTAAVAPRARLAAYDAAGLRPFGFDSLPRGNDATHHLPTGYDAQMLLRWGDALHGQAAAFSPAHLTTAEQQRRFGYNNDFIAFMPLPFASGNSSHGLLCVNHEYTNTQYMWPDLTPLNLKSAMTYERTATEIAAIGHSVVEVARHDNHWSVIPGALNRRITGATDVALSGPAAGHARLRTRDDPSGRHCLGILNPCSGGKTPWGTVLIGEENFNVVFRGKAQSAREQRNHARYGVGNKNLYSWWSQHFSRFDVAAEPHEANRFGWVVEFDPYDAQSTPVKRTALGRFKHEAATCVVNPDGRVVIYSGDDEAYEYLYRFVSDDRFDPQDREANRRLLDAGTLSVARFFDDGRLSWQPLRFGEGPLTAANDFTSQADVLIETRRAADLVGATQLDRPEDVEANPVDGVVYALLTNNVARHADSLNAANPRRNNRFGHILRLLPPGAPGTDVNHAADDFRWTTFVLAGNPADPTHAAQYPGNPGDSGWFAAPDNCAFDAHGRIWIATDQGANWQASRSGDGLWACAAKGNGDYDFRCFFRAPIGAEVCGPEFTPDGSTLFLAIQHPGVDGVVSSGYSAPATRWPDFDSNLPPRPAVVAITRADGGTIGD